MTVKRKDKHARIKKRLKALGQKAKPQQHASEQQPEAPSEPAAPVTINRSPITLAGFSPVAALRKAMGLPEGEEFPTLEEMRRHEQKFVLFGMRRMAHLCGELAVRAYRQAGRSEVFHRFATLEEYLGTYAEYFDDPANWPGGVRP